jgi:hypothetical protein
VAEEQDGKGRRRASCHGDQGRTGEKLVAQTQAFRGATHQARNVDELLQAAKKPPCQSNALELNIPYNLHRRDLVRCNLLRHFMEPYVGHFDL